ncbi:MAG: LacI family DNA-binding transcriptional regulator [Truepera sp.]|nr:LacI family DNA-binding transcriptional regulator [Truepera sp.]
MTTIKEVSRIAQVSMATVSRVLTGSAPVAEPTRARVMAAMKQTGYSPNAFARSLATNRSGSIGVVINEISSPFYSGIVRGIEEVVEAVGMHLMVSSGHANRALEFKSVESLRQRRADALIVQLEAVSDYDILRWAAHTTPLVVVGRYVPELADRCIYLDNVLGGYLATKHLLDHGHRRIAHITGWLAIKDARDRLEGYRQALAEAGIPYDEGLVVEGTFVEEGGQRGMKRLLSRQLDFTAVIAGNDQTAAGALHTLREHGLQVPHDVSLIGYDDVILARYLYPALTTIRQPLVEMGRAAAQLALTALGALKADVGEGVIRKFEPTLVVRESVVRPKSH